LPAKNQARWVLPLDAYRWPTVDKLQVALQLLAQQCIQAHGYEWVVVTDELWAGPGESWSAANRKLFTVHLAEKYGYGNSFPTDVSDAVQNRIVDADLANRATASQAEDVTGPCLDGALRKLGLAGNPEDDPHSLAADLGIAASDEAQKASTVQTATRRWRACMVKVGLPDLPADPTEMPPESIRKLAPAVDAPTRPSDRTTVPAEERRVAVADAKCQASSGWATAMYNAQWEAEVRAVAEHADELARQAAKIRKLERRAEKVIAADAPSAE
jgi:hypothetical protein